MEGEKMQRAARQIGPAIQGFVPLIVLSGRQTSKTQLESRMDYDPKLEQHMTPQEWNTLNQHMEAIGNVILESMKRPPSKGHQ